MGAPGFEDWSGESILFELPSHAGVETFTAEEPASYAGYSVANIYIKGEYFIVQGVPRGAKTFGKYLQLMKACLLKKEMTFFLVLL